MKNNNNSGCLSLITSLFQPKKNKNNELLFTLKNSILTPAELSFYKILKTTMQGFEIQCKVKLDDIFKGENYYKDTQKINRKHIDFLLCNQNTMKPILGIELDDSTHEREDRKNRDDLINEIFKKTGLPIIHIKAQRTYNPQEVLSKIKQSLNVPQ